MQRALGFYRDLLGLPLTRLLLEDTWAEFELAPDILVTGHGDSFTPPGGDMVALAVDDEVRQERIDILLECQRIGGDALVLVQSKRTPASSKRSRPMPWRRGNTPPASTGSTSSRAKPWHAWFTCTSSYGKQVRRMSKKKRRRWPDLKSHDRKSVWTGTRT